MVDRYQRQTKEYKQSLAIELIHAKSFKDVVAGFNTSPTTVMTRFDEISSGMLETKSYQR